MSSQYNGKLYHYTTPQGLIGIVNNNELWASDIFSLNDAEELMRGVEIARRIIDHLYDSADDAAKRKRIERIKKDLSYIGPSHNITTLVCSFTEEGDLLSQWRAYCQGGGYAIGFPFDGLRRVIEDDFILSRCNYDSVSQERSIQQLIDDTVIPWIEHPDSHKDKLSNPWANESDISCGISSKFVWDLYGLCAVLKNGSFSEEKEWRIVSKTRSNWHTRLVFRDKKGLVIPYVKIPLPKADHREFWNQCEVIVGPTLYPEEAKTYARRLLRSKHKHAIPIKNTVSTYREL